VTSSWIISWILTSNSKNKKNEYLLYSIVIPVYNRPLELSELLESIAGQQGEVPFEVIVVEDGSDTTSESVVKEYLNKIKIKYCFKNNSGPGDSRNYGMQRASGRYFILLDSDCLLPSDYLLKIDQSLASEYADAYGGPDAAHPSFSIKQKGFNYAMTSFLSTGGLRGSESAKRKFQLRSFNMGLSREAFEETGGFARQRIGEDIDLNFRLMGKGLKTRFLPEAFVYHKRRTSWKQFFAQTRNFGAARPVLNRMHPGTARFVYWLPSFFLMGFLMALTLTYFGFFFFLILYGLYAIAILADATGKNKSILVGLASILSVFCQFFGYGSGFFRSVFRIYIQGNSNRDAFPKMFA
jgi:glycosyltransferase involved in cell wall biosynthesis